MLLSVCGCVPRGVGGQGRRAYRRWADAEATVQFAAAAPGSYRRVALMLGWVRDFNLPWDLASRLPRAFARAWGGWSRDKLLAGS